MSGTADLLRRAARLDMAQLEADPTGLQRVALESVARQPSLGHARMTAQATGGAVELRAAIEKIDSARAESRSGTRHSEAERAKTYERPESIKVRLRRGYRARLRSIAEAEGYTAAEQIEIWIEQAEQR